MDLAPRRSAFRYSAPDPLDGGLAILVARDRQYLHRSNQVLRACTCLAGSHDALVIARLDEGSRFPDVAFLHGVD